MERIPVTAVVSTKNEEAAISECVRRLARFAEVIVVDSMSTDETRALSLAAGARVVDFAWNGEYPKKKQWCLDNVPMEHEWVLFIDADEAPTPELADEIAHLVGEPRPGVDAYDIPLAYHFSGQELKHGHKVRKRVLLRRGRVSFPVFADLDAPGMGELEGHYQPTAEGDVGTTIGKLLHDDPDPFRTWIDRHNKYSDWEAYLKARVGLGRGVNRSRSKQGRAFQKAPFKPLAFFVYSYVARLGFLDGRAGFRYAFALAWYYWAIDVKVDELRRAERVGQAGTERPTPERRG